MRTLNISHLSALWVERIRNKYFLSKTKRRYLLLLTAVVASSFISLFANQYPNEFSNYFYVVKNSTEPYRCLDVQLVGLDYDGNNERWKNCVFSYKNDDGTYENILSYEFTSSSPDYTYSITTGSVEMKGYVSNVSCVEVGKQYFLKFKWYFPAKLAGKTISLRMGGTWIRDYATTAPKTDYNLYYNNDFTFQAYEPNTTVSIDAEPSGNYKFNWSNAGTDISMFSLYTDKLCSEANKVGVVTATTASGSYSLKLNAFNQSNTYYIKQSYTTPANISGFSISYSKILGQNATNPGYKYPSSVSVTPKLNEQKIELGITVGNPGTTLNSKYFIKRNGTLITPNGTIQTSYTDNTISPLTDYTYTVYTVPGIWKDSLKVIPELSKTVTTTTKPKDIVFTNFKLTPYKGTNPYIKISWDNSEWYPVNTIKLYRKNTITGDWVDLGIQNTATYLNDIADIVENKYFTYKFIVNQWGKMSTIIDSAMVIDQVSFSKMSATKNIYGDRINIQWTIDRLNLCDRFEIYRSFAVTDNNTESWSKETLVNQMTAQTLVNSWDDRDAAAGTLYKYKIVAIKKTATIPSYDLKVDASDIGFRMPVGVVTGRITYGTGSSVKGASLYVSSSNSSEVSLYKSLKFTGEAAQGGNVNLTKAKHGCIAGDGFTFQAWLKPLDRNAVINTIFEVAGEYSIRMNNDNILVLLGNPLAQERAYKIDASVKENSFFHLGVVYGKDKKLKISINGVVKDSVTLTKSYSCTFAENTKCVISNNTDDILINRLPYKGYIDDVRLWNKGLTNSELAENYNHYLGGSESGLIGYWPMDEGIGTYAFDCSKTDKVFNESHITDIKKATSDTDVPDKTELSIKGVTDANGNYIIRGIPFTGEGSTYSITPVMGTHKFEPKQQLRYVSPSSLVHNGTDFADKSSFPVPVNIKYENTDYPVEGVSFYIDDNPVAKENKLVLTDEKGQAIIDIPIGEHDIKVSLNGHGFKNNGRFPSVGKIIVDEGIQPISFTDTTLVSITGKVAGGLVENAKPLGFRKGKANIGEATIILKPAMYENYSLNNTGNVNSVRVLPSDTKINSISTIEYNKSNVVITTDPATGEYFVKLPPIKEWVVSSVTIKPNNQSQTLSQNQYSKTFKTNPLSVDCDTVIVEKNKVDSFKYNVKQNFIYRVEPTINVTDVMAAEGAYGDSTYVIQNATDPTKNQIIKLYSKKDNDVKYLFGKSNVGGVTYPNGKPVFNMGNIYTFKIEGYEEYFDPLGKSTKVSLGGAAVSVDNEMGKLFVAQGGSSSEQDIPKHEMTLNAKGYIYYQFQVGFPRLTSPEDGLSLNINLTYNNKLTPWNQNGKFRGIVMGYEPVAGANFKTRGPGPLIPLVVLRDPPGTNSYAYMEKGTKLNYSMTHKHTIEGSFSVQDKLKFGVKAGTVIGMGVAVITEASNTNSLTVGLEGEYSSFTGTTTENSLELKERIQTSASPDFVGSMADVYIGTSTNVFTTDCNILDVKIENNDTLIYSFVRETSDLQTNTEFRLSQYEILHAQIPAWEKTIRSLFLSQNADGKGNIYTPKVGKTVDQIIKLMGRDENGLLMYNVTVGTKKLGDQVDSAFVQIKNWQNLIKKNEMSKYTAKTSKIYEKTNISFDAGTSIERSYTFSTKNGTTNGSTSKTQESLTDEFGIDFNGFGMEITLQEKFGGGRDNESTSDTENSTSFGYLLSDPDTDNRFSVNVYKNKFLSSELKDLESENLDAEEADANVGSYIFELAAGQTSCPYESADSTIFYKGHTTKKVNGKEQFNKYIDNPSLPLMQLSTGSQALDIPKIDILPVRVKTDIPNGKEASFSLKLENGSAGYSPRSYVLSVDESSNKDGAIISVDGTPLTEGRTFYITKGEPLYKTLTVRQTKLDVLDYENIKLNFSSSCTDVTDSKYITVKYIPSCSDLDLVIDSLTMNTETGNTLLLKLRNFNQDYTNFMGIKIEYKLEGQKDWSQKILAKRGVNFGLLHTDTIIPEQKSQMDYRLNFKGLTDGRYVVRAMTLCSDPNSTTPINNITPEFIVVKDMIRPSAMGTPSPSGGILTPSEEVSLTFNEPIQSNRIVETDFDVEGVLNGAVLQHAEGLALDGSSTSLAFTEAPVSLQNSSFAIEGWIQTNEGTSMGNLFSIGEGVDKLSLKMNKSTIELFVNDIQIGASESITQKNDWQYVSLNYDAFSKQINVYVINSEENQVKLTRTLSSPINPVGRLLIGSGFKGKIHQVAIWNTTRTIGDLSDMNYAKSGAENNLVGYWPIDEANGKMAVDKVSGRNLTINSAWFVEPNGKSVVFNGTNSSFTINTQSIPLTSSDNFSVEFWFNGNSQTDKTLFSCGKGIGDISPDDKLSIGFNESGLLSIYTKDVIYPLSNVTALDGNWHHFALSVSRSGYGNVYIDGKQLLQIPSSKVSGLANSKMTIGSRNYINNQGVYVQDRFFNGKMDEVRIWKCALSSENIRLDMRSKLTSTVSGLVAYYPFEKEVNSNGKLVEVSLENASSNMVSSGIGANLSFSDVTPGIKMSRQKVKVNFDYTASDNKIIFSINETMKKIENCVLEFTAKKVLDMNGNELTSPIKWTAYVNNNQLKWVTESAALTKAVLDSKSFTATIANKSGKYENYVIDGLPGWLSVNKTAGRLNPLEKADVTFTVDNSINVGNYECRVTLTGNNGIQEMLPVSLKVTGVRPDWTVNPYDFESSMNITGQVTIEGIYQEDTEDILAAFIGTKCVGLVKPQFSKTLNSFLLYMDVYGNSDDIAKNLTFSLWDAGTGRIYPDVDVVGGALNFSSGSIIGSVSTPKVFNAIDKVEQQLNIKKGWNWISANVVNASNPLLDQVKMGLDADGLIIKSKTAFTQYSGASWVGALTSINQRSMYLLRSGQSKTVKITGATSKVADYPIAINQGWNWIGFVPQFIVPVKEALSSLNLTDGDQIKGQIGFAIYSGGVWNGSLQYLVPGQGYMFNSTEENARILTYPTQYIAKSNVKQKIQKECAMHWTYNEFEYPQNMTIIGKVKIDNIESVNSDLQIAAFIDNKCRGTISLMLEPTSGKYYAYLTVLGDGVADLNKKIVFKCFNPATNTELVSTDMSMSYLSDSFIGSPNNPYLLPFTTNLTNNSEIIDKNNVIYPNPVNNILYFGYDPSKIEKIEIIDYSGRVMVVSSKITTNSIDVENLIPGIYTIRINSNGKTFIHRFVKQ